MDRRQVLRTTLILLALCGSFPSPATPAGFGLAELPAQVTGLVRAIKAGTPMVLNKGFLGGSQLYLTGTLSAEIAKSTIIARTARHVDLTLAILDRTGRSSPDMIMPSLASLPPSILAALLSEKLHQPAPWLDEARKRLLEKLMSPNGKFIKDVEVSLVQVGLLGPRLPLPISPERGFPTFGDIELIDHTLLAFVVRPDIPVAEASMNRPSRELLGEIKRRFSDDEMAQRQSAFLALSPHVIDVCLKVLNIPLGGKSTTTSLLLSREAIEAQLAAVATPTEKASILHWAIRQTVQVVAPYVREGREGLKVTLQLQMDASACAAIRKLVTFLHQEADLLGLTGSTRADHTFPFGATSESYTRLLLPYLERVVEGMPK
jgi:hypothetical protein